MSWLYGRPPPPKWLSFMPASSTDVGSISPSTEIAIEQQMSAECMPGWIASLAATTPPTGMVPGAAPDGQASGITVPATSVGTRISSAMCLSTVAMLSASSGSSARMLSVNASRRGGAAHGRRRGGGAKRSTMARMAASSAPDGRAFSAAGMAAANQGPGG